MSVSPSGSSAGPDDMETSQSIVPQDKSLALDAILRGEGDPVEQAEPSGMDGPAGGWDEEGAETTAMEGFCVECEGQNEL